MREHARHAELSYVSVVALINVATRAQSVEAEAPGNAARLAGEPPIPSTASTVAIPAVAALADAQAPLVGSALPPLGSATAMKSASEPQVTAAAHQSTAGSTGGATATQNECEHHSVTRRLHHRHRPVMQGDSLRKAPASATHPRSHKGLDRR